MAAWWFVVSLSTPHHVQLHYLTIASVFLGAFIVLHGVNNEV